MGLADLVPGVSGGTIALISGIYNKLISLLARIDLGFFILAVRLNFSRLQKDYEVVFFIVLGLGILSGIAGGVKIAHYMLEYYPQILYAFFGGLICSAAVALIKLNNLKSPFLWLGIIVALGLIWGLRTNLSPTPINVFIGGALAISAMLLPGISGSFVLLLLGLYESIIIAAVNIDLSILVPFLGGIIFMLFGFSRIIMLGLNAYNNQTLSFMLGLMLGALPKLWPWQNEDAELISPAASTSHSGGALIVEVMIAVSVGILIIPLLKKLRTV